MNATHPLRVMTAATWGSAVVRGRPRSLEWKAASRLAAYRDFDSVTAAFRRARRAARNLPLRAPGPATIYVHESVSFEKTLAEEWFRGWQSRVVR